MHCVSSIVRYADCRAALALEPWAGGGATKVAKQFEGEEAEETLEAKKKQLT